MSIKLIDNENLLHKNAAVSMYMQGVQQSLNDPNQGMGLTDTEKMFKDQFVQIAQETFLSKAKKYADKVEDFIVLDVIPEKNYGFGAFMLNLGEPEDTVYVPIIMQNSQIKPILMMFNDTFDLLPFTAEWVDYIQQNRAERIIESVNDVNDSWNSATGRSDKGRSLYPTSASEINVRGITQPPNLITSSGAVGMATGPFDVDHPRNSQTFTQVLNPVFENFDRLAKRASDSNENGKIKVDLAIQDMEERVNTVMRIIKSAAINVPGSNSNLNTSILSRVEKKKSSEEAEKILSELTSENDNDTVKMFLDQMRSNSNFLIL
jgi:hypothetical protein